MPRKKYTDEDLKNLFTGRGESKDWVEPRFYATLAYDEYLRGNLSLSVRLVDRAIRSAPPNLSGNKCEGFSFKASILAEAGDYKGAEQALSSANRYYGMYMSWKKRDHTSHNRSLLMKADVTRARAAIYFAQGNLTAAELTYRQLLSDLETFRHRGKIAGEPASRDTEALINLARVLLAQGRTAEAEFNVREAIRLGFPKTTPHAFIALSRIFFEKGRFDEARICARTGLHAAMSVRAPIDAFIRANARQVYARALFALGHYRESLEQFNLIKEELKIDSETFDRRFKGNAVWGLALLMNGDTQAAIEKMEFAARQSEKITGPDTYAMAELQTLRAMALAQAGQKAAARKAFDLHVPLLLKNWNSNTEGGHSQNARSFKFRLILEAYLTLLADTGKTDDIDRSFQYANALQDKIIGQAVALSSARAAVKDPALADLIRQQQDLDLKLSAFKNRLTNALYAPPELINTEVITELQNQVETLNLAARTLEEEIKDRFPEYANIIDPENADVALVRKTLDSSEALISIFCGSKYSFVWAIPKTGSVALAKVPIGKNQMATMVGKLRKALNPGEVYGILELPQFDLSLAYSFYEQTLKPVEAGWQGAKHLMVVTQGPIGQIPLFILPTTPKYKTKSDQGQPAFSNNKSVDWLIKTHSVTVLPSVSALVNLRSIKTEGTQRLAYAGFGDPYFSQEQLAAAEAETQDPQMLAMRNAPIQMRGIRVTAAGRIDKKKITSIDISMLNRLPDTREEVINIAATLKADTETDVFIGTQASEQNR